MVLCFCQNLDLETDGLHYTLKVHADPKGSCGSFWGGSQIPTVSASQTFTRGALFNPSGFFFVPCGCTTTRNRRCHPAAGLGHFWWEKTFLATQLHTQIAISKVARLRHYSYYIKPHKDWRVTLMFGSFKYVCGILTVLGRVFPSFFFFWLTRVRQTMPAG